MNELQLIADCKEGKRNAQKMLYETYARMMYAICLRYASNSDDAKDLLQDGFLKVFDKISMYEGKGSFEGWLKRVFVNLALENIRKRKDIFENSDDIQNLPDVADDSLDEESMYNISEDILLGMIQGLSEGYSAVFNLYAIEGYAHKDIAQMLGISEGTSRSQYIRARRILQDKVKQYLLSES